MLWLKWEDILILIILLFLLQIDIIYSKSYHFKDNNAVTSDAEKFIELLNNVISQNISNPINITLNIPDKNYDLIISKDNILFNPKNYTVDFVNDTEVIRYNEVEITFYFTFEISPLNPLIGSYFEGVLKLRNKKGFCRIFIDLLELMELSDGSYINSTISETKTEIFWTELSQFSYFKILFTEDYVNKFKEIFQGLFYSDLYNVLQIYPLPFCLDKMRKMIEYISFTKKFFIGKYGVETAQIISFTYSNFRKKTRFEGDFDNVEIELIYDDVREIVLFKYINLGTRLIYGNMEKGSELAVQVVDKILNDVFDYISEN